ncbi:hypothetical protein [Helicobacter sp. T3_23-1059]
MIYPPPNPLRKGGGIKGKILRNGGGKCGIIIYNGGGIFVVMA